MREQERGRTGRESGVTEGYHDDMPSVIEGDRAKARDRGFSEI